MKAITIRQPYAHRLLTREKRCEYRSWDTSYRGPIILHAGKKNDDPKGKYPLGAIVGVMRLVGILDRPNEYAWRFAERIAVKPVPFTGKLGLYSIADAEASPEIIRVYKELQRLHDKEERERS